MVNELLVMILERVKPSLRGELTRWLIEPKAGVFVGKVSALVKEKLWNKCLKSAGDGSVVQIWTDSNEQGFSLRCHGERARNLVDMEGIVLVCDNSIGKPIGDDKT